ncbi:MAG: tetratricopeptide repeat protein [bacterium]
MGQLDLNTLDRDDLSYAKYLKAELMYDEIGDNYLARDSIYEVERESYENLLKNFEKGILKKKPKKITKPVLNYLPCIKLFQEVVEGYKESPYLDAAMYSMMFCYFEQGNFEKAKDIGEQLVLFYPQSQFAPQTYMILGEYYYFNNNNLESAKVKYKSILDFPKTKLFDKALYKLGWTHYRLSEPRMAIKTFTYLIKESVDLTNEISNRILSSELFQNSDLVEEAIAYIAISFAESDTLKSDNGVINCRKFVKKLAARGYSDMGAKILHKIGDVYSDIGKLDNALNSYESNMKMFPKYKNIPVVKMAQIYLLEKKGDFPKANEMRIKLYEQYFNDGKWADAKVGDERKVIADSIAELALRDAATYYFSQALQSKNMSNYLRVIDLYNLYIKTWPERGCEPHYNIGELFYHIKDYARASKTYIEVSKKYDKCKYAENASWNAIASAQRFHQEEIFNFALELEKQGKPGLAMEKYNNLIEWYPDSKTIPEALYRIIIIWVEMNECEKAKATYLELMEKYGDFSKLNTAFEALSRCRRSGG